MKHVRWQWVMLLGGCGLVLVACGPESSPQQGDGGAGGEEEPVRSADVLRAPDTPVSGLPGQPGAQAQGNVVQGQVTSTDGKSIAEVIVLPQSADTPPQAVPEVAVVTDEQGRYQWSLPTGAYTLTFTKDGYAPLIQPVVVAPDRPATLDVVLQKP